MQELAKGRMLFLFYLVCEGLDAL